MKPKLDGIFRNEKKKGKWKDWFFYFSFCSYTYKISFSIKYMEIIDFFPFFVNFFPSVLRVQFFFFVGVKDDSNVIRKSERNEMIFIGTPTEQCGLFILMTQF